MVKRVLGSMLVVSFVMSMAGGLQVWSEEQSGNSKTAAAQVKTDAQRPAIQSQKDKERVLATLDGKKLRAWQAELMVQAGAAADLVRAVDFWIEIQLRLQEAQRRGLDRIRENAFIADLFRDNYMGNFLMRDLQKEAPKASEEEARNYYDKNLKMFEQKMRATVRHITLQQRDYSREVVQQAKSGTEFAKLYNKYGTYKDRMNGLLRNFPYQSLQKVLGKTAADAIKKAKAGDILGPFVGVRGFEVVKVISVSPDHTLSFKEAKSMIMNKLNGSKFQKYRKAVMDRLKSQAKIVKSPEYKQLLEEKQKKQKKLNLPGQK